MKNEPSNKMHNNTNYVFHKKERKIKKMFGNWMEVEQFEAENVISSTAIDILDFNTTGRWL